MKHVSSLSWDNFRSTVFLPGEQRLHQIQESPLIAIYGDGINKQIGIYREGKHLLEISTSKSSLYRLFYQFAQAVAERITSGRQAPLDAVQLEFDCFSDLLEEKPILSMERQIGLIGELLFLEHLVERSGIDMLDSWLGPMGEPHDFRLRMREFEVKTTINPRRVHTINGLDQLAPSEGCSLHLVSVMLGPSGAGPGYSLADKVIALSRQFSGMPQRFEQLLHLLEACGYRNEDRNYYTRRYSPRRPMAIIQVGDSFPKINRQGVARILGESASRIEHLSYDINLEGLQWDSGLQELENALGL